MKIKEKNLLLPFFQFLEDKGEKRIPLEFKVLKYFGELPIEEEDLHVKGNLSFRFLKLDFLPDNLVVDGSMDLTFSSLEKLPKNLKVKGSLDITLTRIKRVPHDLYVGEYLYVTTGLDHISPTFKKVNTRIISNSSIDRGYSDVYQKIKNNIKKTT